MKDTITHNGYCNIITRMLFTIALFISTSYIIKADSFHKYVGETFYLPLPDSPISSGFVNSYSFSCSSTKINVTNNDGLGIATITSYFDGTITIECYFQYIYYLNNTPYSGTSKEYHQVSCKSNDISITGNQSTLNVGETLQLSYKFAHISYDATPQITWKSSNTNVATVNYSGLVTANQSGESTITATSNLGGNVASYTINVQKINPTSVSITPSSSSIPCEGTVKLSANVYPSGASQNVTWSIVEGSSNNIATVNNNGLVTGLNPGNIKVKATSENGISSSCNITVYKPSINISETSPLNNATSQSVFITPSITFSHNIYKGNNFDKITLESSNGDKIDGTCYISGKSVIFKPNKALNPNANHIFNIPANSIKNKWDTHYSSTYRLNFTTGDLEKLILTASPSDTAIKYGTEIKLTSNKANATIYYTINGKKPSTSSLIYNVPIIIEDDTEIKAIAILDGYEDSDILTNQYVISNPAPQNIRVTTIDTTSIGIAWDTLENALSYKVHRGNNILTNTTNTFYTDDSLVPNKKYCYTITAIYLDSESAKSDYVCATTIGEHPALTTPENIEAVPISSSEIKLTWDKVDNATKYNVYRGNKFLAEVEETFFIADSLEYDTRYCFTISSVNNYTESEKSDKICAITHDESIHEHLSSVNIYPNPVINKLNIEAEANIEEIMIYTVTGVLIYNEQCMINNLQLDVNKFKNGVYYLKIRTTNGNIVKCFIKQ